MAQGYLHNLTIALAVASAVAVSASQSPGAGAILINGGSATAGVATLDVARRIILTSGGNDTGITFTLTGTDRNGRAQSETVTGANAAAAQTTRDFKTITGITHTGSVATTLTVGTNGVASSNPLIIDNFGIKDDIGITLTGTGTFNASIEVARDDLSPTPTNFLAYDFTTATPTWTAPTAFASKAATTDGTIPSSYTMIRLTQNSFTSPGTCSALIVLPAPVGRY